MFSVAEACCKVTSDGDVVAAVKAVSCSTFSCVSPWTSCLIPASVIAALFCRYRCMSEPPPARNNARPSMCTCMPGRGGGEVLSEEGQSAVHCTYRRECQQLAASHLLDYPQQACCECLASTYAHFIRLSKQR